MRLTVEQLRKIIRYDPETGALLRYPHWKPVSINAKGTNAATIEIGGLRYSAKRVVWALMTGEWPTEKPHFLRLHNNNPNDLRWVNFYVVPDGHSRCARCEQIKLTTDFHATEGKKPRISSYCKTCKDAVYKERDYAHIAKVKKYGMTVESYDELLRAQDGRCAICKRKPDKKRLAVDHCHTTNVVRGLLCQTCNTALGQFTDDPKVLLEAAKYLLRAINTASKDNV